MVNEIWKDLKGYEGLYQVSNLGNIKRIIFRNRVVTKPMEKLLKFFKKGSGYFAVSLYKDCKKKNTFVHRLVAENFIENNQNKKTVNHIDGNKFNNHVENLEWCTYSENHKHAFKIGLKKPRGKAKEKEKDT